MGVSVVFFGLLLTYLTIVLIIKVPILLAGFKKPAAVLVQTPVTMSSVQEQLPPDPEKIAVIATILEIELRLRKNVANTRFTFRKR